MMRAKQIKAIILIAFCMQSVVLTSNNLQNTTISKLDSIRLEELKEYYYRHETAKQARRPVKQYVKSQIQVPQIEDFESECALVRQTYERDTIIHRTRWTMPDPLMNQKPAEEYYKSRNDGSRVYITNKHSYIEYIRLTDDGFCMNKFFDKESGLITKITYYCIYTNLANSFYIDTFSNGKCIRTYNDLFKDFSFPTILNKIKELYPEIYEDCVGKRQWTSIIVTIPEYLLKYSDEEWAAIFTECVNEKSYLVNVGDLDSWMKLKQTPYYNVVYYNKEEHKPIREIRISAIDYEVIVDFYIINGIIE